MPISKDEDLALHLKRQLNSCFASNYLDIDLKAWQASMDIQPFFNEFKAVTYMCQHFSKTEINVQTSSQETFENNMHHHDTMKTIAKAYLSNREYSVPEPVCHILREFKLKRIFQLFILLTPIFQVNKFKYYFLKNNLVNYQILIVIWKDQKQHSHSVMENSVLTDFCYAEFLAYDLKINQIRPVNVSKMHHIRP